MEQRKKLGNLSPTSAWRKLPSILQKGSLVESAKETDKEDIKLKN